MKRFLLLLLALPCFLACHQVKEFDDETYITFAIKDTVADPINWQQENIFADFKLRGKDKISYALRPVNDTITQLSRWVDGAWQLQENIKHFDWVYTRVLGSKIISYFKITDFDHDGDQDLTLWIGSDVHTNMWTIVLINDEKKHKLVKLLSTADYNSDIWDDPHYDPLTGLINTELYSGAYGIQNTATYKLQGTTALPIFKEEVDLSNHDNVIHDTYVGENGKWKLIKTKIN